MLIFYYSYELLDYYRLQQNLDLTTQLDRWIFIFGTLFSILFFVAIFAMHIVFRKNIKRLTHYLLLNIALFAGIALINFIVFMVTSLRIGNLMQTLILIIIIFVDLLLLRMRNKEVFYT